MATTHIYFSADDPNVTVRGSAAMNSYCNGLLTYYNIAFAALNESFVSISTDRTDVILTPRSPNLLFKPPAGYNYPDSSAMYRLWNNTKHIWLGSTVGTSGVYLQTFANAGQFTLGDDLHLYPLWKANKYTIDYDATSGTGAPASQEKTHGTPLVLSTKIPTWEGHTFVRWNTQPGGGGTSYAPGGTYSENANATLYAQWDVIKYTVSFDANGGSSAPSSQEKEHGHNLLLTSAMPTRTGYSFIGWNTKKNGSGTAYVPGGYYAENASATLYAQWKADTYTVGYNGNGGSGIPAAQTKTYGVDLTLSTVKPVRTGYSFVRWNTQSDGSGTSYAPGASYKANAGTTLYAQWSALTYKVTYNANGGIGAPAQQTKQYNVTLTLSSTTPTRSGYTFVQWNTKADGTGSRYAAGASYSLNAALTLYAQWTPVKYNVTYNANGGTGVPAAQQKIHGQTLTLSTVKPTREGYKFANWNTNASGSGTTYKSGASYTANAALTLYAQWTANPTITITFNANGGTGAPASVSGLQGTSKTVPTTKPTKSTTSNTYAITYNKVDSDATVSKESEDVSVDTNYAFSHWNTRADGKGVSYKGGNTVALTTNMTLYAIYSTSTTGSATLPTGTLDQYTLKGWSESADGSSIVASPYTPKADTTLYAIWVPSGLGGMIKFDASAFADYASYITPGAKIRLYGMGDPGNDGLHTVATVTTKDGVVSVTFVEGDDFVASGEQDAVTKPLEIYGEGTFVPDMDYICSLNNRLWGCSSKNRTIYGSALGDPTDFWRYQGDSLDAYAVAVGSAGDFTGCLALNSTVLFYKQHTLHKLMGNFPAEYAVYTYEMDGISEGNFQSTKNCEGVAIYVAEHGIGTYAGADSGILSKELGEGNMNNAIAMYDGEKYALAYTDDDGESRSFVYDTRYRLWLENDYGTVMSYAHLDDDNYVLVKDDERNAVYKLTTDEPDEDIDWQMTFKPYIESYSTSKTKSQIFEKKRYTGIRLRMELPHGSWIKAEVKADDRPWQIVARKAGSARNGVADFTISTPRCDKLQLRLSGHGQMTILSMEREYLVGSRR